MTHREPGRDLTKDERDLLADVIRHGQLRCVRNDREFRAPAALVAKGLATDEAPDAERMLLVPTEAGRAVAEENDA